jgi:hypothetical protein
MPHDGHIARAEAFARPGLVLLERDVENPVQSVLDPPMAANGLGGARGVEGSKSRLGGSECAYPGMLEME